jgi:hypothetical protein
MQYIFSRQALDNLRTKLNLLTVLSIITLVTQSKKCRAENIPCNLSLNLLSIGNVGLLVLIQQARMHDNKCSDKLASASEGSGGSQVRTGRGLGGHMIFTMGIQSTPKKILCSLDSHFDATLP